MTRYAWVTLTTNDTYALGALVLAHSLRQVGTIHEIAVLITSGVSNAMRDNFAETFDLVQPVDTLHSRDEEGLDLLHRPELGITFTKLHCWRLTKYDKCVFLDADTMVLDNIDELFLRDEFSAAPDVGWPDCFNSGVFVYTPSLETFTKLIQFAREKGSFDGADQGLLNLYFSDWAHGDISKHLPFIYNVCSTACYSYMPAYKQYGINAKIIHFIGATKPWSLHFNPETRIVNVPAEMGHLGPLMQKWWDIFSSLVHPVLTPSMAPRRTPPSYFEPTPRTEQVPIWHSYSASVDIPIESEIEESDFRNVWDPWDDYEQNLAQPLEHISHAEIHVSDSVEHLNSHNSSNINHNNINNSNNPAFHEKRTESQTECNPILSNIEVLETCRTETSSLIPTYSETQYISDSYATEIFPNIQIDRYTHSSSTPSFPDNPSFPPESVQVAFMPATSINKETALHSNVSEVNEHDSGMAAALAELTLDTPKTKQQEALDDHLHKQCWEVGNIDYMGSDSFANIWSKICQTIADREPTPPPTSSTKGLDEFPVGASNDNELSVPRTCQLEDAETKNMGTSELNTKLEDNEINITTNLIVSTTTAPVSSVDQTAIALTPTFSGSSAVEASTDKCLITSSDSGSKVSTSATAVVSDESIKNVSPLTLSALMKTITDVSDSFIEPDAEAKSLCYEKEECVITSTLKSSHTPEHATKVYRKSDLDMKTNILTSTETQQTVTDTSTEENFDNRVQSLTCLKPTTRLTLSLETSVQHKPVETSKKIIAPVCNEAAATLTKDVIQPLVEETVPVLSKEAIPDVPKERTQKLSKPTRSDLSRETVSTITQTSPKKSLSTLSKGTVAVSNKINISDTSVAELLKSDTSKSSAQSADTPAVPPRKGGGAGTEKRKGGKGKNK